MTIVKLLLGAKARASVRDADGKRAADLCSADDVRILLEEAQATEDAAAAAAARKAATMRNSTAAMVRPGGAAGAQRTFARQGSGARSFRALVGTVEAIAGSVDSSDPPKVKVNDLSSLASICQKGWLLKRSRHFNVSHVVL